MSSGNQMNVTRCVIIVEGPEISQTVSALVIVEFQLTIKCSLQVFLLNNLKTKLP